ncbi:ENTPD1 [Symbiodinium microadriaticum]|nr:ENTPD1 [Symbiodinium microadriaticum]
MTTVRELLMDKKFCPFYFQFDFARVISGEEEAAYAWAAANYLYGTLLPSIHGSGAVNKPLNGTFGTVDLGGASTQIAFFVPSQDISEGLFKLQIGSQRHWNIYAKSFLKYGHNSARERHFAAIAERSVKSSDDEYSRDAEDDCLFSGYSESLSPSQTGHNRVVVISGPAEPREDQFDRCSAAVQTLLNKRLNEFCNTVYDNECSMDGFYQPKLPSVDQGHFIGSATYKYPWKFLKMPDYGSLEMFKSRARIICSMTYNEILTYNDNLKTELKRDWMLPYYCFLSTYISVMLEGA